MHHVLQIRHRNRAKIDQVRIFTMRDVLQEALEERIRRELSHLAEQEVCELARVIERLAEAFQPERIYVFGSQARGEATPNSDIDLLIVVAQADEPAHRLAQVAYRIATPHSLALDLLVMPRDEFESRSRAASSLPATVLREGRVLYAA
jgi:predicted nucleotidyltransferase